MFAHEHDFDAEVKAATATFPVVPPALVKAIIAAESAFNPKAMRGEPQANDASRGLMQLLYTTAQGQGYKGDPDGLFTPMVSIYFGTSLLNSLYASLHNWPDAISAYNGGIRPALGFGGKATRAVRVCLAWGKDGQCERWQDVAPGEYANKSYVNKVLSYQRYFNGLPLVLEQHDAGFGQWPVLVLVTLLGLFTLVVRKL